MNRADDLWKIIHERKTESFGDILPILKSLNIRTNSSIMNIQDYLVSAQTPFTIYLIVKNTAEILEKSNYNNPYSDEYPWKKLSDSELRHEILKKIRARREAFFGDIPDELERLGYNPNNHKIREILDYTLTRHYSADLIDRIVENTLSVLNS